MSTFTSTPPAQAIKACQLRVCRLHGDNAPRLFCAKHDDGAGHTLKNILLTMAVAVRNGMNFGGFLDKKSHMDFKHGHDFRSLLNRFFGSKNASYELIFETLLDNGSVPFIVKQSFLAVDSVYDLEKMMMEKRIPDLANVYLPNSHHWARKSRSPQASLYFTAAFVSLLRQPLLSWPVHFAPNRLTVAMHVRRGDINPHGQYKNNILRDQYFYDIVDRLQNASPAVDIHAFSSTDRGRKQWYSSADFDGYRRRGVKVHLDGPDLVAHWVHMARADVFVMSPSSFSYVPAFINPSCVIHPGPYEGFPQWMDGKNSSDDTLKQCISRSTQPL